MNSSDLHQRRRASARAFIGQARAKNKAWDTLAYAYEREDQMYLGWFDDNPKKTTHDKIGEAIVAYIERFQARPNVVLVNEADRVEVQGMTIRAEGYIRKSNFWVGWEDAYRA